MSGALRTSVLSFHRLKLNFHLQITLRAGLCRHGRTSRAASATSGSAESGVTGQRWRHFTTSCSALVRCPVDKVLLRCAFHKLSNQSRNIISITLHSYLLRTTVLPCVVGGANIYVLTLWLPRADFIGSPICCEARDVLSKKRHKPIRSALLKFICLFFSKLC